MFRLLGAVDNLHEIIGMGAVLATGALAVGFGGPRQRIAGVLMLADTFSLAILSAMLDGADRLHLLDGKAILILVAYGVLTVRWPDRWIILLTGLQGFAVMLRLAVRIDPSIVVPVNGLMLNVTGWLMLAVLAAVTVAQLTAPRRRPAG